MASGTSASGTSASGTSLLTAEELLASPWANELVELVAGVIVPMTPAGGVHGAITSWLNAVLAGHVRAHGLGATFSESTGFVLARDPDTVRCSDVAFVSGARLSVAQIGDGFVATAPDLAAEVLSPSESASEVTAKVEQYLAAGVRLVWVVDPRTRTVTVHAGDGTIRRLREGDALDGGSIVPGFTRPVAELFADIGQR